MAKESGLGVTTFSIDDSGGTARAVLNDVRDFTINTPRSLLVVTGLDKSAEERIIGMADASVSFNYIFNDAATTGIFTVLKNFATIFAGQLGRTLTLVISGQTFAAELLFEDFPWCVAPTGRSAGAARAAWPKAPSPRGAKRWGLKRHGRTFAFGYTSMTTTGWRCCAPRRLIWGATSPSRS